MKKQFVKEFNSQNLDDLTKKVNTCIYENENLRTRVVNVSYTRTLKNPDDHRNQRAEYTALVLFESTILDR